MIHLIGTAALWVGVVAGAAFCGLYALTAPWWKSEYGWHLMSWVGALTLILGYLAYRSLATPTRGMGDEIGRLAVYAVVAGLLVWRLTLLWREQIQPRRRERTRR